MRDILSDKKIAVYIETTDEPLTEAGTFLVKGEQLLCYSMLANLFSNAIEASPKGGEILITLSSANGQAAITMKNRGAVPEEIRTRFFDKFVTQGKEKGTGIGTYSARLMATTMQGDICLDASEIDATTVAFSLQLSC